MSAKDERKQETFSIEPTKTKYVVEGSAGHFIDMCDTVTHCIRCESYVDKYDEEEGGWCTLAQVFYMPAPQPPKLRGGVYCEECRKSFLTWMRGPDDDGQG